MASQRTEYSSLLVLQTPPPASSILLTNLRQASLQPEQAINVLNDRVSLINKVNSDIADWLQVSDFACDRTISLLKLD